MVRICVRLTPSDSEDFSDSEDDSEDFSDSEDDSDDGNNNGSDKKRQDQSPDLFSFKIISLSESIPENYTEFTSWQQR